MGYKKILEKLLRIPPEMRIEEINTLLNHLGYNLDRIQGSHFIFTKAERRDIIVPAHNKKVHWIYLKKIAKLIILNEI